MLIRKGALIERRALTVRREVLSSHLTCKLSSLQILPGLFRLAPTNCPWVSEDENGGQVFQESRPQSSLCMTLKSVKKQCPLSLALGDLGSRLVIQFHADDHDSEENRKIEQNKKYIKQQKRR